jgi:hypothetical protein
MLKMGNKIRLTEKEKYFLEVLAGETANPQTVAEYNAWLRKGQAECDPSVSEERLLAAMAKDMELAEPAKS